VVVQTNDFVALNMSVECTNGSKIKEPKPLAVPQPQLTDDEADSKYRCVQYHRLCMVHDMPCHALVASVQAAVRRLTGG
jgi:hypothetical protein